MLEELNTAIDIYVAKWQKLLEGRRNKRFFEQLRPTSVGWKTEDFADFQARFIGLRDMSEQIHMKWMNERWIATMHLKDDVKLGLGIEVIKLMQRRPNSKDAVGLDHIDFLIPENVDAPTILAAESGLSWTDEANGEFCKWISIWFEDTEAKLRTNTSFSVCIAEMQAVDKKLLAR